MSTIVCAKLLQLGREGHLISAWAPFSAYWREPLLRAHQFERSSRVASGPGIHAVRYGMDAAPASSWLVVARCEVPPGTYAVMSPWALRAQRLLITGLRFCPASHIPDWDTEGAEAIERAVAHWSRHVDILPADADGPTIACYDGEPSYACGESWRLTPYELHTRGSDGQYIDLEWWEQRGRMRWHGEYADPRLGLCRRASYYVHRTPEAVARDWRERLAMLTRQCGWPDDLTRGWRDLFGAMELRIYRGI